MALFMRRKSMGLVITIENADDLIPIIQKALKYNKNAQGQPLKQSELNKMRDQAEDMTKGLLDAVKTVQCHEAKRKRVR